MMQMQQMKPLVHVTLNIQQKQQRQNTICVDWKKYFQNFLTVRQSRKEFYSLSSLLKKSFVKIPKTFCITKTTFNLAGIFSTKIYPKKILLLIFGRKNFPQPN